MRGHTVLLRIGVDTVSIESLESFFCLILLSHGGKIMEKIGAGGTLPNLTLKLGESGQVRLPDDITSDYAIVLFYRGHW